MVEPDLDVACTLSNSCVIFRYPPPLTPEEPLEPDEPEVPLDPRAPFVLTQAVPLNVQLLLPKVYTCDCVGEEGKFIFAIFYI
jgi:hypothetical protein